MGLFLVLAGIFTFGTATLEKADRLDGVSDGKIAEGNIKEALKPIVALDYSKLND